MARSDVRWSQPSLLPLEAVEAVLRVGVVGPTGHAQLQLEVRDPISGDLLAMESTPHLRLADLDRDAERSVQRLLSIVAEYVGPF